MEGNTLKDKLEGKERYARPSYYYRAPIYIDKNGRKHYYRFTVHQRIQHVVLFTSVLMLILTGFPLKYPDMPLFVKLYDILGGISIVPTIHHIAGTIMCLLFFYHTGYFLYVYYKKSLMPMKMKGELTFKNALIAFVNMPMIPNLKDFKDFFQSLKYILFISDKKPEYSKFMWKEKFDYYGVYWGIPILGLSGLIMWKRDFFSHFLPGVLLNISYIGHTDEALLAATFLLVWHFYNVHLHLHKFPMGRVFLTGYLTEEEMIEEHYDEYVRMMKQEGLEHETKGQYHHDGHAAGASHGRRFIKLIYGLAMMALIAALSYMILNLTVLSKHGFFPSEKDIVPYKEKVGQPRLLEEIRLEGMGALEWIKEKREYSGYKLIGFKGIKGHFHNIGLDVVPDNRSRCIKCHGDLSHEDVKRVRAFLNMHSYYLSCEACHSRPAEGEEDKFGMFRWYAKKDGSVVDMPVGSYDLKAKVNYKVIPFIKKDDAWERLDSDELIALSDKYMTEEKGLTPSQKAEAMRSIHRHTSREAVKCRDCHTQKVPYLPFRDLGYSDMRMKELQGAAVIGMIEKYEKFYLPQLFKSDRSRK